MPTTSDPRGGGPPGVTALAASQVSHQATGVFECIVFAYLPGQDDAVPAGRLKLLEQGPEVLNARFGYGAQYLKRANALPVDPISLPLDGAVPGSQHEPEPVNGLPLFGAIRDALPDLWGRRVIENRLGAPANSLSESVYMVNASANRFGALDFRATPDAPERRMTPADVMDLAKLLDAAGAIERNQPVPEELANFFDGAPTLGGARPKMVVQRRGVQHLAKFPSHGDRWNVPLIEYATLELARRCGMDVPPVEVLTLADGRSVMLTARFDRTPQPGGHVLRHHVVSALTLLGLHESQSPDASYAQIARALGGLGASGHVAADRAELFRRMVFNILVSNNDDHLRNHAFLWQPGSRGWHLSPLYDVTPAPQIASQRMLHLGVGTQGRLATLDNAMTEAAQFGLHRGEATDIVDQVAGIVREWRTVFEALGVPTAECDKVASAFRKPRDVGLGEALR